MIQQKASDLIVFDNLVQANSDIAGDNLPVKARKESGKERKYAQANASGELYRPKNLNDVKVRAQKAGKRFNALFSAGTTI